MDAVLEKQVDQLGRSSRIAAAITVLGVAAVGCALVYGTLQLRELQKEVTLSEKRLTTVNAEWDRAASQVATLKTERDRATVQIATLQKEKEGYEQQIVELRSKVDELQALLLRTTDMSRFRHAVDMVDLKYAASEHPRQARILQSILELREGGTKWRLGGTRPEQGFDSPSFAAYILESARLIPNNPGAEGDLVRRSRMLRSLLPAVPEPAVGDVVFYPGGYVLFYFRDQRQKPFVIGMTPQGIVALEPTFAPVEAVSRPRY